MSPSELLSHIDRGALECTDLYVALFSSNVLSVHAAAMTKLLALKLHSSLFKVNRLEKKLAEQLMQSLALYKYFVGIACSYKNLWDTVNTIGTESKVGILLDIGECSRLLQTTPDYAVYLRALLSLVESIVEYTTAAIIRICVAGNPQSRDNQYMVALVNLKLVTKLQSGFQSLDLKNDDLRRKVDAVKYSVQKLNALVYDLSLRKLIDGDVVII